jgi:uncharacterized protein YacL (UPF0231 family)
MIYLWAGAEFTFFIGADEVEAVRANGQNYLSHHLKRPAVVKFI